MDLELTGHRVLVTGSSRGIGKAIAAGFAAEGAVVALTGRTQAALLAACEELAAARPGCRVEGFPADLTAPGAAETLAEEVRARLGGLEHLVCNLGSGRSVPVLQEDAAEWERMLRLNLLCAADSVRAFLPLLPKPGQVGQSGGVGQSGVAGEASVSPSITFVSSICGVEHLGCPTAYAAAKAALRSYAKTIAEPLGRQGIRVNVVAPGNVLFPGSTWEAKLERDSRGVLESIASQVPLERFGTAREIADVVVFLASRRAGFVAGAQWVVDGGQARQL